MHDKETITLFISVISTIISFVALYRTHRISKRQIELQEIQANLAKFQHDRLIEEQQLKARADVRAHFENEGRSNKLIVENLGPSDALNVQFKEIPSEGRSPFLESEINSHFPIQRLRKGESKKIVVSFTLATVFPVHVSLYWSEENGNSNSAEFKLSL